ncbi:putative carboxypeptidase X1 [Branchiostoma floridae x Branchiostoma belcheri]
MESGDIPDDSITASSFWSVGREPYRARLNGVAGAGAWAARFNTIGEWLQVDLGEMMNVTGTIIQGRYHNYDQWVTSYKLQYSVDGLSWITCASSDGYEKVFPGNTDRNTPVTNLLDSPIAARYVRFLPQSWHDHMSMRVEVLGCSVDGCETAHTGSQYRYRWKQHRLAGSRFTFEVQANSDAHVALSSQRQKLADMYEIVIGAWDNTWSVIRRSMQGYDYAKTRTPGINSPREYRTFWITWSADGTIAVGRGGETQPFMQWRDPDPLPIAYAGYSTGWGSSGRWKFCHTAQLAGNGACVGGA